MAGFGGAGGGLFGDPFGTGGPLHVTGARAVAGQVVRVVYDEVPIFHSAAGASDALNPDNYSISVVSGQATAPVPVGVGPLLVVGPVAGVPAGDFRAVDLHVDRAFVFGITYRVSVIRVAAAAGGALGAPTTADFAGVVQVHVTRPPAKRLDNTDFANDPFVGKFVVDDSGDIAIQAGLAAVRKRILRRLVTPRNAFAFLPGYGVGLRLKDLYAVRQIQSLKTDVLAQVGQEPEVTAVSVSVSLDATGFIALDIKAQTRSGVVPVSLSGNAA